MTYPYKFIVPPGLLERDDHVIVKVAFIERSSIHHVYCKCGQEFSGTLHRSLKNMSQHMAPKMKHTLVAVVMETDKSEWEFLCSCGFETIVSGHIKRHFGELTVADDISTSFVFDHSFLIKGKVLNDFLINVVPDIETTMQKWWLTTYKDTVIDDRKSSSVQSNPSIALTPEGDRMFNIVTARTISGYVGQVHVQWDNERGTTIVWESQPFSDDLIIDGIRMSAQDRAKEAAETARNTAVREMFEMLPVAKKK